MHQNEKIDIVSLYDSGLGIRKISQKVGISKQAIKMRLIKSGCYRGASRKVESSQKKKDTDIAIPELELWETTGGATIEKVDNGWLVSLPAGSKIVSPAVDNKNRAVEFSLSVKLLNPSYSLITIGIKNAQADSGSEASLQKSVTLNPGEGHLVQHLANKENVQAFIKSGDNQGATILVSNLRLTQVSGAGLKPVIKIVPPKKLEVGEKVALSWTPDGAARIENYPDGKRQVTLPGFSSLYARIPAAAWEKKVKATFELDSYKTDLTIILGDNSGEVKETINIRGKQFFQISKHIGRKAYCRLDNRGYDRQNVFLISAECEIIKESD